MPRRQQSLPGQVLKTTFMQASDIPICRVCRSEGTTEQPLFYPCRCSGSIKYIHEDCLVEWLNHSKKRYCELCKYPFTFSPVYAPQMPSSIPLSVLVLGTLKFAAKFVRRALLLMFAVFLWGFLVPILTANIFKYYFGFSLQGLLQLTPLRLLLDFSSPEELQDFVFESSIYLLFDVVQGLLICGFTIFLGLGMLLTRELQSMVRVPPVETEPAPDSDEDIVTERDANTAAEAVSSPVTTVDETTTTATVSTPQENESSSNGYWLDRVHPKEYKRYVQRCNLQRQMMVSERLNGPSEIFPLFDDSFSMPGHSMFDDNMSNISGATTLRTTATSRGGSNADSLRCRICYSTTCVNRDHVIQASRIRIATMAARNQVRIERALETDEAVTAIPSANSTPRPVSRPRSPQPVQPIQPVVPVQPPQPQQPQQEDEWGINLDADAMTFSEFFGFSPQGGNPVELIQNASIVVGCNTLIMIVFLCLPSLFGSHVLKESLWKHFNVNNIPPADKIAGFTARLIVGYGVLAVLLSFYHSLAKRFFRDPIHRAFLPALGFFGTFCKLITLLATEMAAFPVACGLIVDVLTLPLFPGATISSRLSHFHALPISSLAIHWALGAAFMLSFASHVTFLRSFLRPGLLYFLRNPADPEAHPLREMLERSFTDQVYRLFISYLFYGFLMSCSLGGAVQIVSHYISIAPLKLAFSEPMAEIPVVLLLHLSLRWLISSLQPSRLAVKAYQTVARSLLRSLNLASYFLGKHADSNPSTSKLVAVPDYDRVYSRKAMQAIRRFIPESLDCTNRPAHSTIVYRPKLFGWRCLIASMAAFCASQVSLVGIYAVPLVLGRRIAPFLDNELISWFVGAVPLVALLGLLGSGEKMQSMGRESVKKAVNWCLSFLFIGLLWPLAFGLIFTLCTGPLLQIESLLSFNTTKDMLSLSTPIIFFSTCWSVGFPLMRVAYHFRAHLPIPQRLTLNLEAENQNPLQFLLKTALPITFILAAAIVIPPLSVLIIVPFFTNDVSLVGPLQQVSHLAILLTWLTWKVGTSLTSVLGSTMANIRDDAYLVGRQLHNLEREDSNTGDNLTSNTSLRDLRERRIPTTPIL